MAAEDARPAEGRQYVELLMPVVLLVGVILCAAGAWMAWEPAGLLVAGGFLVLIPLAWARGGWAS